MADDASACGEPPVSTNEDVKATIDGQADFIFKRLGSGDLKGTIETSRRDVFLQTSEGQRAARNRQVFVAVCTLIMHSKTLSDAEKIEKLKSFQVEFSEVHDPASGTVLGGWLHYSIGPCRRQGVGVVHCDALFESYAPDDRALTTFVPQTGGIRNVANDRFGVITAIDNLAKTYKAKHITVGNLGNAEEGPLSFTLFPRLKTPVGIDFEGVDSTATTFYRLTIPFANSNGAKLDMVISNIAIN